MRKLANIAGVDAPTADYPKGRIVDNQTVVSEAINGDMIQFFQRLVELYGIVENEKPDNTTNGYQTIEALRAYIFGRIWEGIVTKTGATAYPGGSITSGDLVVDTSSFLSSRNDGRVIITDGLIIVFVDGVTQNFTEIDLYDSSMFSDSGSYSGVLSIDGDLKNTTIYPFDVNVTPGAGTLTIRHPEVDITSKTITFKFNVINFI